MALDVILRIALRNVVRHWRHSVGTLLSIALGFVALGLFEGYLHDLFDRQSIDISRRNLMGHLLIEHRGASSMEAREEPLQFALGEAEQAAISAFLDGRGAEVQARVRLLDVNGLASAGRAGVGFGGIAHDVDEAAKLRGPFAWNVTAGVPLHVAKGESALLALGLGKILRCEATSAEPVVDGRGQPIAEPRPFHCNRNRVQLTATTEAGRVNATTLEIGGLFSAALKELDNTFLLIPLAAGQRLLDTKKISMVSVVLAPDVDVVSWAQTFNATVGAAHPDVAAIPLREHRFGELQQQSEQILKVYRSFVIVIVIAIAGMSVLMTMMKSTNERIREIGTLRAVGYRRRHIVALFASEAVVLGLVATLMGGMATLALTFIINGAGITYRGGVLTEYIPLVVAIVPSTYAFAAAFLPSVALVASLAPAWRASRVDIAAALADA